MSCENSQISNKKIIVVASPTGRVGSSALMGLFKLAGINLGGKKTGLSGKAPMAPKGFFEIPGLKQINPKYFKGGMPYPIDINDYKNFGKLYTDKFIKLLNTEFGNNFPIAIKSLRLFIIPMLHEIKQQNDIYIIRLRRDLERQSKSLQKVFKRSNIIKTLESCKLHILRWQTFEKKVWNIYQDFVFIDVTFEDLINKPIQIMSYINDKIKITLPPNADIKGCL
ncbi:unnamed protein product, partial [marine sediment metagenome]